MEIPSLFLIIIVDFLSHCVYESAFFQMKSFFLTLKDFVVDVFDVFLYKETERYIYDVTYRLEDINNLILIIIYMLNRLPWKKADR